MHFYEALLATLAIVVWHFYTVIFDPDVYPMDTAWLTGAQPEEGRAGPRPARQKQPEPGRRCGRLTEEHEDDQCRNRRRRRDHTQMSEAPTGRVPAQLSPLIHLSNNWISLIWSRGAGDHGYGVLVVPAAHHACAAEIHENPIHRNSGLSPASRRCSFCGTAPDSFGNLPAETQAREDGAGLYPATNFPSLNAEATWDLRRLLYVSSWSRPFD
jgi:hypothetical protein